MTIITSLVPAPSVIDHMTSDDIARNVRVIDVATGETIPRVISADVEAGTVSSYAVDEDGNLVRENDKYQILVVDRAIHGRASAFDAQQSSQSLKSANHRRQSVRRTWKTAAAYSVHTSVLARSCRRPCDVSW